MPLRVQHPLFVCNNCAKSYTRNLMHFDICCYCILVDENAAPEDQEEAEQMESTHPDYIPPEDYERNTVVFINEEEEREREQWLEYIESGG